MSSDEDEPQGRQVNVRFVTKMAAKVPDTPFSVPSALTRFGLSEIVNHLLANDPPTPFDFLVGSHLLRSSLETFMAKNKLSEERTLTLEYLVSVPSPTPLPPLPHSDWVSCVALPNNHPASRVRPASRAHPAHVVVSGSYDAALKVWALDDQLGVEDEAGWGVDNAHNAPIKCIDSLVAKDDANTVHVLTGSKDHTVKRWAIDLASRTCRGVCVFTGHSASVDALALSPSGRRFLSGSWDNAAKLWDLAPQGDEKMADGAPSKKQKKGDGDLPSHFTPLGTFTGHTQAVSAVQWMGEDAACTASWDHSLVVWDVEAQTHKNVLTGKQVIHALSHSPSLSLLLSGDADNKARVWDPRVTKGAVIVNSFASHMGPITSVQWAWAGAAGEGGVNPNHFLTSSLDGCVKVWDMRAAVPLHTVRLAAGFRVLDCKWLSLADTPSFVFGASDANVHVRRFAGVGQ